MKITYDDHVDRDLVSEAGPHRFTAFASDLGLRAGDPWPTRVETDLGNGLAFIATHREVRDGDLQFVRYDQANGCVALTIFND